jgi:hypothetical protein
MYQRKTDREPENLAAFDHSSEGHNEAIWKRAKVCQRAGLGEAATFQVVSDWAQANALRFARIVPWSEVRTQCARAFRSSPTVDNPPRDPRRVADLPINPPAQKLVQSVADLIERCLPDFNLESLKDESEPHRESYTVEMLRRLLDPNGWVCVGDDVRTMQTVRLSSLPYDACFQYVVPNNMTADRGLRIDGTGYGARTRANACTPESRVFTVVEYDLENGEPVPKDVQARRLWFLHTFNFGLSLVVNSGGKSLQGWFDTGDMEPRDRAAFWTLALATGCDPAGAKPEQPFRAPYGCRPFDDKGRGGQQRVEYFSQWGDSRRCF